MKRPGRITSAPVLAGTFLVILGAALPAAESVAARSVEAGQSKAIVCAACHGVDGNSLNPEWPSLAGQYEAYIVRTLQAFKKGERSNVLMTSQAMPLSNQDMADLAAYFASRQAQKKTADPAIATAGERLYRGDPEMGHADRRVGGEACPHDGDMKLMFADSHSGYSFVLGSIVF